MSKFKVGDKVIRVEAFDYGFDNAPGPYVVNSVNTEGTWIRIENGEEDLNKWYYAKFFDLYKEPQPKTFEVGDKVRLNNNTPHCWWGKPGMEGVIRQVRAIHHGDTDKYAIGPGYDVQFPHFVGATNTLWGCYAEMLDKISEKDTEMTEFKFGDKVMAKNVGDTEWFEATFISNDALPPNPYWVINKGTASPFAVGEVKLVSSDPTPTFYLIAQDADGEGYNDNESYDSFEDASNAANEIDWGSYDYIFEARLVGKRPRDFVRL